MNYPAPFISEWRNTGSNSAVTKSHTGLSLSKAAHLHRTTPPMSSHAVDAYKRISL